LFQSAPKSVDPLAERVPKPRPESGQGARGRLRVRGRLNQRANFGNGRIDFLIARPKSSFSAADNARLAELNAASQKLYGDAFNSALQEDTRGP
jgi:hypothetical protein